LRQSAPPARPRIEVSLEKASVCEGEENLVTVRATVDPGEVPFLVYRVGAQRGSTVALRAHRRLDGTPVRPTVTVTARNGVQAVAVVPPYEIRDCQAERIVHIEARELPNLPSQFQLSARIVDRGSKAPFRAIAYRWTFGDGQTARTTVPAVVHSYADRIEDTLESYYTVRVDAIAEDSEVATGHRMLALPNIRFTSFATRGVVLLRDAPDQRFDHVRPDGVVHHGAHVSHDWHSSVTIDRVWLRASYDEDARADARPRAEEQTDPRAVFGDTRIPPEGVDVSLELDTAREPSLRRLSYRIEGHTDEGWPVTGFLSVMRPAPAPTRSNSQPVRDPVLLAKILRARDVLQTAVVTDEDLIRLDAEGHFDGLRARSVEGSRSSWEPQFAMR
jgi:hypothetical protein